MASRHRTAVIGGALLVAIGSGCGNSGQEGTAIGGVPGIGGTASSGDTAGGGGTANRGTESSSASGGGAADAGAPDAGAPDAGSASGGSPGGAGIGDAGAGTANGGTANGGTANGGTAGAGTANGGTASAGTASAGTAGAGTAGAGTAGAGTANGGTAGAGTAGAGTASAGAANGGTASAGTANGGTAGAGTASAGAANGGTAGAGTSGYSPKSPYLISPNQALGVMKSLADFRAKSRDDVNGGFFSFVKLDGTVSADRRKGFVTTSRDAWTFSRAFMVTGDEKYLELASHALSYLYAHGWDNTNGGWFFTSDEFGKLTAFNGYWDPNRWKWSFMQHYALLGIGANCDATRDATTCAWMKKGSNYLDTKMWDSNASQLGYFDQVNLDGSNPINKGFTATVDALTTNAIQAELLWPTTYHQRMVDLADIVVKRLANSVDLSNVKFGFPENYNSNWNVNTAQTGADVGHVLKSAWVLARVYLRNPDERYRAAARKFIYDVLNNGGWDQAHGIPYTHYDWSTGQVTKQAECWQIEQAVTSGLSNWYIADNQADKNTYLQMADRALQFFDSYVIDHARGGTYKLNDITGEPAAGKSNFYNVEYHSTELFYFTYLYGNLLLHRTPIALYYKVPAASSQQVIQLNPVAADDISLQIQSVTLDGLALTTFSAASREVTLAAGQGGKLHVVFAPTP